MESITAVIGGLGFIGLVAIRQVIRNIVNDLYGWSTAKLSRSNEKED